MSEWIEWNGGEMPVAEYCLVDVRHRDGEVANAQHAGGAGGYAHLWDHDGSDGDIVAYRVTVRP